MTARRRTIEPRKVMLGDQVEVTMTSRRSGTEEEAVIFVDSIKADGIGGVHVGGKYWGNPVSMHVKHDEKLTVIR